MRSAAGVISYDVFFSRGHLGMFGEEFWRCWGVFGEQNQPTPNPKKKLTFGEPGASPLN